MDLEFVIEENVTAAMARAEAAGADLREPMGEIAVMLSAAAKQNFKDQADPLGVPWKASARAQAEGGLTLVETGDLFGSIKEDWGAGYASAGPEASGGAAIYAAIHQWGGVIRRKAAPLPKTKRKATGPLQPGKVEMPARPYLGWNDRLKRGAVDILSDFVTRLFTPGAPTVQTQ